ncbi:MAG TPA: hypothetical protein DCM67_01010 [Propionibacteriaceae bacterium]|nr:hypothetical protein [Propionibacteriaceae bacterium]
MPLTPSHIAAVIPLKGRPALPFAALAAGSMSPDLWYYLPGGWVPQPSTHTPWGILVWDLLFGVAMWVAWRAASGPLYDLAPELIRRRWRPPSESFGAWRYVPLAVLIGAASHVLWDEFTHAGRFGDSHIAALAASYATPVGPVAGYQLLQYLSGVLGLAIVAWVGLRLPHHQPTPRRRPRLAMIAPPVVTLAGLAAVAMRLAVPAATLEGHSLAFIASTVFVTGAVAGLAVLCGAHAALERHRSALERASNRGFAP